MKIIIKLLIVAAVLNGVVRGGLSASTYYRLKDAAQQLVIFGARMSRVELQNAIVAKAAELGVTLAPDDVVINREGFKTLAQASYTDQVEIFPNYRYPVRYAFEVEGISTEGPAPPK